MFKATNSANTKFEAVHCANVSGIARETVKIFSSTSLEVQ